MRLTLSSANYQEILQKRFGNKQLIISKHMETLLTVEADQNLKDLRRQHRISHEKFEVLRSGIRIVWGYALLCAANQATYRPASHCQP